MNCTTRLALVIASFALLSVTFPSYLLRPDSCAALTVWPAWVWTIIGLLATVGAISRTTWKLALASAAAWMVYTVLCVEEIQSAARLCRSQPLAGLRIVSLNCAGNPRAAEEVLPERPDIVLLQESPTRRQVDDLARRLGDAGTAVAWGPDASILSRGQIVTAVVPHDSQVHTALARVQLTSSIEVAVVSVRLPPAPVRMDLWNPDCWRDHTADRRQRREWLRTIVRELESFPTNLPLIVGGDFNAPGGDAIFDLFRPHLSDAFRAAGRGWGATLVNDMPMVRIDQVWVSYQLRPQAAVVRKTSGSDHRMLICDLQFRRQ
jgi:endonuclease/exonuclease/phosphatase (EEP) superfamily protein YafD